jgi:hypothetical protein
VRCSNATGRPWKQCWACDAPLLARHLDQFNFGAAQAAVLRALKRIDTAPG